MNIIESANFCMSIERLMEKDKSISAIDATIIVCDRHKVEIELVLPLLNRPIIEKIETEARKLNYLPRESAIPDNLFI